MRRLAYCTSCKMIAAAMAALFAADARGEDMIEAGIEGVIADGAHNIAIALTDDEIAIDTGFSGARLTLFGALSGLSGDDAVDIVSVIRGPDTAFRLRLFEQRNLIWAPGETRLIENAPGLYITSATRPINDIIPLHDQETFGLTPDHLSMTVTTDRGLAPHHAADDIAAAPPSENTDFYRNAFLSELEDLGLYQSVTGGVSFKKGSLFTINVDLPATTPVGDYEVAVFLYRDGVMLGADAAKLAVNKVGLERQIYELAHDRPVTYGLLCVAMSLAAGWIASLAFRK